MGEGVFHRRGIDLVVLEGTSRPQHDLFGLWTFDSILNAKRNLIPSSNSGTTQSAAQEKEVCAEKTVRLRANNVPPPFVCREGLDSAEEVPIDMTGNW